MSLASRALRDGESAPATLNAANEVAVQAFLDGVIGYMAIPKVIEAVMNRCQVRPLRSLPDVLAADKEARVFAEQVIGEFEPA